MAIVANKPGLDPSLPDVSIILGGEERHLVFDLNAIVLAERETGINLLKAIVSEVDATKLRGLLWASLLTEYPDLTIDEVGTWIRPKNVQGIHQALIAAWFASVPEPDANDAATGKGQAQAKPTA